MLTQDNMLICFLSIDGENGEKYVVSYRQQTHYAWPSFAFQIELFKRPTKLLASDSDFSPILKLHPDLGWDDKFLYCCLTSNEHYFSLKGGYGYGHMDVYLNCHKENWSW